MIDKNIKKQYKIIKKSVLPVEPEDSREKETENCVLKRRYTDGLSSGKSIRKCKRSIRSN